MYAACLIVIFIMLLMSIWASNAVPYYQINDGRRIPGIGLGTWFGMENKTHSNPVDEDAMEQAVEWAMDEGYRLIDTGVPYLTEGSLWNDAHARIAVVPALRTSLMALNLSHVDMYLVHFPIGQFNNGTYDLTDYVETWLGMIDAKREGLARSIGVSNFNTYMIKRLIKNTCVKPAVAQFEENLTIRLKSLLKYCCKNGIAVMGYSPFGSVLYEQALPGAPPPRVDDPVLWQIAGGHNKTVPQIILRYFVDLGVIPIPKSINKTHIQENIDIFDFSLLPEERIVLGSYNVKYTTGKIWSDSPYYLTRQLIDSGLV